MFKMDTDKQKEQKISLYIDKGLEFDQYKKKHYTNYLTAITDTVFKHAPQISDKNIFNSNSLKTLRHIFPLKQKNGHYGRISKRLAESLKNLN